MSEVWVVTAGVSHEGDSVIGVTATERGARALADEHAGTAMEWTGDGTHSEWHAFPPPSSYIDIYEVTRWEVAGGE